MSLKTWSNVTSVNASASAVQLFASTDSFISTRVIVNDSSSVLYVKFGTGASATSYTYKLAAGDTLELSHPVYDGVVTGIWVTATGAARCTEVGS